MSQLLINRFFKIQELMSFNEPNILIASICTAIAVLTSWFLVRLFKIELKPVKYETVDGLRGYLAFFVFLHHACIYSKLFPTYEWKAPTQHLYIHFGQTSVSMFFMITGFLFFDKLLKSTHKRIDWTSFFIGRIMRIYPLFIFALFVVLIIVGIKTNFERVVSYSELFSQIKAWFLFGIFDKPPINNFNEIQGTMAGVLWSMKYEWMFYLALPFFGLFMNQRPSIYIAFACGFLLFLIYNAEYMGLFLFGAFLYGLAAAILCKYEIIKKIARHYMFSFLCCAIIVLLVINFDDTHFFMPQFLTGIAFILIACGNSIFGLLTNKFSKAFGQLAYSIYLLHGLILFIALRLIIGDSGVCGLSFYEYWTMIVLIGIVITTVCFFTYYRIELPCINKASKLKKSLGDYINKLNKLYYK